MTTSSVTTSAPAAEAHEIVKTFGATRALVGAELVVRREEAHGLIGRNGAGKSTLVSILTGIVAPEGGTVAFDGQEAPPPGDPLWQEKVACVYQRPKIFPNLSVAENLFANELPVRRLLGVDRPALNRAASELLDAWQIMISPTQEASRLTVEQRQLLEIARALRKGSRFIILDEPTARLEAKGIEMLFAALTRLRANGVAFLYISHHLSELFDICDSVSVLRNGRTVRSAAISEVDRDDLIEAMVGAEAERPTHGRASARVATARAPIAEVQRLSGENFGPVSLTVGQGEIVGVAGHAVSGIRELGESLAGLQSHREGTFSVHGVDMLRLDIHDRFENGLGFVPEDRHRSGFVGLLSVEENLTLGMLDRLMRFGVIRLGERSRLGAELIERLEIYAGGRDPLNALSGGNQQKVVMGRALASHPSLLILMHPTAGVDVASKEALFDRIAAVVAAGGAALLFSDEYDELRICSRVYVLYEGRVIAEMSDDWEEDELVAAMEGVHAG